MWGNPPVFFGKWPFWRDDTETLTPGSSTFRLRPLANYDATCHAVHSWSGWNPTLHRLSPFRPNLLNAL